MQLSADAAKSINKVYYHRQEYSYWSTIMESCPKRAQHWMNWLGGGGGGGREGGDQCNCLVRIKTVLLVWNNILPWQMMFQDYMYTYLPPTRIWLITANSYVKSLSY